MDKLWCSVEAYLDPRMKNLLKLPAGQANFPRRAWNMVQQRLHY